VEKPDGRTPLKISVVSVRIIYKMDNQEVRWGMGCIDLAQNRDGWPAVVNAIMNLRVP